MMKTTVLNPLDLLYQDDLSCTPYAESDPTIFSSVATKKSCDPTLSSPLTLAKVLEKKSLQIKQLRTLLQEKTTFLSTHDLSAMTFILEDSEWEHRQITLKASSPWTVSIQTTTPLPFSLHELSASLPKALYLFEVLYLDGIASSTPFTINTSKEAILEEDTPKKSEEEEAFLSLPPWTPFSIQSSPPISTPMAPRPSYVELFETLCTALTSLSTESFSQTTFYIKGESFKNSIFYGSEIEIKEYKTAPREFNILIKTSEVGAFLVQTHMQEFWKLFQEKKYSFTINRMETDLLQQDKQDEDPDANEDSYP